MVSILENVNQFTKQEIYDLYSCICPKDLLLDYNRITRKKMIEEIIEMYTPEYILSFCTSWELKALKRLLRKQDLEDERYAFSRKALSDKFLYFERELPVEFKDNVKLAIKDLDLDAKAQDEKKMLSLIGLIRCFGIIEPVLIQGICQALELNYATLFDYPLFNYWVYLKKDYELIDGSLAQEFVYRDYEHSLKSIRDTRIAHQRFTPKFLPLENYISFFYHGYDATNTTVEKFFRMAKKEIQKFRFFKWSLLNSIITGDFLANNEDYPAIFQFSSKLTKAYEKALLEIQTPALYGMSVQDYIDCLHQMELNDKIKQMNQLQTNAHLSDKECKQFYKLYFGLLDYVNKKLNIIPNLKIAPGNYLKSNQLFEVIHEFWNKKDEYIDEYCKVNPLKLTHRNLNSIQNFKYGIRDTFVLVLFEKNYTVINYEGINYMVKGLYDNMDEIVDVEKTPMIIETTLLPFEGQIIYDGLMNTSPISLGPNQASKVFNDYSTGQKIYTLIPKKMQ